MNKLLSILLMVLIIVSSTFVNVLAAVGTEQKLYYKNKDDGIPMFMATEDGESFYVYCFNSNLAWPDRPDEQESGYTIQTYVPNDFLELDSHFVVVNGKNVPVKDMLHRIFYAGFPHNNAGLYIQDDNYSPTLEEMTKGLVFEPEILTLFPELNNGVYTYKADGTGTLNNPNTTEGQTFINVGLKMMEWIFGTPEEQENFKKLQTQYRDFYAFAYAYYSAADYDQELDENLSYFYLMALGSIGATVTRDEAHSATQIAIWIILNRANVPFNTKTFDENNVEGSLVRRLVDFAYGNDPIPERNFSQESLNEYKTHFNNGEYLLNSNNESIKDNGGIKFTYNPSDGKYYSEILKFERNKTEELREKAYLSKFNIEILNSENEVISETIQYGKEDFVLVCDEEPAGAKVRVKSDNYWPSPIYQYRAKSDVDNNEKKYQEMSGVKYEDVKLNFSMFALDENADLTIKKIVNNKTAAQGTNFWFNANITIKDVYGNQVAGWLDYTKYKLDESGNIKTNTGVNGRVYNFGKNENNTPNYSNTKFSLEADEAIVIHNLPYGTTYSIEEYGLSETGTSTGNWAASYAGNNGEIGSGNNIVTVTNDYKFNPIEVQIQGTKTLKARSGGSDINFNANDFSFILWPDVHGNPMPSDSVYDSETLRYKKVVTNTAPNSGIANFDFGTISFDKAGTYSYTIEEQQVTQSNITKDPSHYDVTVVVTENGTTLNKTITVSHHYPDHSLIGTSVTVAEGSPATVSFENTYSNAVIDKEIRIKKTVANNASDGNVSRKDYQFKIEPKNSEDLDKYPNLSTDSKSCVVTTGDSGEAISPLIEFTDSWFTENDTNHDNEIELEYKITEVEGSLSYIEYSDEVAYATITVTKTPATESNPVSYSASIKYSYGTQVDVETPPVFTNKYNASSNYTLKINKVITSNLGVNAYTPADGEKYIFTIDDSFERNGDGSGYTLPTGKKVELTYSEATSNFVPNGNVVKFTKAGDYRFELSELTGNVKGITYDSNKWILDINVVDNGDGTLGISDEYFSEQAPLNAETSATFTNNYKTSLSLDLKLTKELLGRELKDDDSFSFSFYHSEGSISNPCNPQNTTGTHVNLEHPLLKVTLNKSTTFSVDLPNAIKVHNVGTYYVSLIEDVPDYKKMEYDSSVYIVEIKTEKDGNDIKLVDGYPKYYKAPDQNGWNSKVEINSNEFKFTNKTTELSIQKKAELLSSGLTYEFEITLLNPDNTPLGNKTFNISNGDNNSSLTTDVNGKATFKLKSNEILNIYDLPSGTKYIVKESDIPKSTTTIIVKENGIEKPLVEGKTVNGSLEAGITEKLIVRNKGTNNSGGNDDPYKAPDTGIKK